MNEGIAMHNFFMYLKDMENNDILTKQHAMEFLEHLEKIPDVNIKNLDTIRRTRVQIRKIEKLIEFLTPETRESLLTHVKKVRKELEDKMPKGSFMQY